MHIAVVLSISRGAHRHINAVVVTGWAPQGHFQQVPSRGCTHSRAKVGAVFLPSLHKVLGGRQPGPVSRITVHAGGRIRADYFKINYITYVPQAVSVSKYHFSWSCIRSAVFPLFERCQFNFIPIDAFNARQPGSLPPHAGSTVIAACEWHT